MAQMSRDRIVSLRENLQSEDDRGTAVDRLRSPVDEISLVPHDLGAVPDRAVIDDLVATLNEEGASSCAPDELPDLANAITVRHDVTRREHIVTLDGSMVDLRTAASPPVT